MRRYCRRRLRVPRAPGPHPSHSRLLRQVQQLFLGHHRVCGTQRSEDIPLKLAAAQRPRLFSRFLGAQARADAAAEEVGELQASGTLGAGRPAGTPSELRCQARSQVCRHGCDRQQQSQSSKCRAAGERSHKLLAGATLRWRHGPTGSALFLAEHVMPAAIARPQAKLSLERGRRLRRAG